MKSDVFDCFHFFSEGFVVPVPVLVLVLAAAVGVVVAVVVVVAAAAAAAVVVVVEDDDDDDDAIDAPGGVGVLVRLGAGVSFAGSGINFSKTSKMLPLM
jgi:hypothetical protein